MNKQLLAITVILAIVIFVLMLFVWHLLGPRENADIIRPAGSVDGIYAALSDPNTNFAMWPPDGPVLGVNSGTKINITAGIRNNAEDRNTHEFLISIKQTSGPASVIGIPKIWTTSLIAFNEIETISFLLDIPSAAAQGIYIFRITACSDIDQNDSNVLKNISSEEYCPLEYPSIWNSQKNFVFNVLD